MPSITTTSTLFGLLTAVAKVSAHGYVRNIVVDGMDYEGYIVTSFPYQADPPAVIGWTEDAKNTGFVAPSAYGSSDIICHLNATNAKATASVKAGGTVLMEWNTWPESHHGPVIDYMASCNGDCTTVDKTTLSFFKIAEKGLVSDTASPGSWASDELIANNNSWSIMIPTTIAPGNYVLRHEIIALHSAGSADGAQNYPQCINLEVTGGGSDVPAGTLGETLYKETDPGVLVNIYTTGLSYVIPGPTLYSGGSGAVATSAAAGTSAPSTAATVPTTFATSVVASSTSSKVAVAASPSATAAEDDDTCEA